MNSDSQKMFESYVNGLSEAQGAPSPLDTRQQQGAQGQEPDPATKLAEMIASDPQIIEKLAQIPAVQQLLGGQQPAAQPQQAQAPQPAAAQPEPQSIPGGEQGNPPLQTP